MTEQRHERTAQPGEQPALERIAAAIEFEVARRTAESEQKTEENRRVRLTTVLLIYLAPLLFVFISIGSSQAVLDWTSDPVKLSVLVAISIAIITATIQAVRLDVLGLRVLSFLVLLCMLIGAQMVLESRKEEIVLAGILYAWPGLWLMYLYAQNEEGVKPLLKLARESYVGPAIATVFGWGVPIFGFIVPYGVFRFTQSWTYGNIGAVTLAILFIVYVTQREIRKKQRNVKADESVSITAPSG